MKQENVEVLYARLCKSVPKSKRESLKASLAKAGDAKFGALNNFKSASKSPIKGIKGLICFFATLFGAVFLACNLFAYLYISPKYTAYSNYSAKLSDDLSAYYSLLADYGKTGDGSASTDKILLNYTNDELTEKYDAANKNLSEKEKEYNAKLNTYRANATLVGNKTANYLNVKIQLSELKEPSASEENYEELKKAYDEKKAELEEKIADYEAKSASLNADFEAVNQAHAAYDEAAKACGEAISEITTWLNTANQSADFKVSLYGLYLGGSDGIIAYMNKCNTEISEQLAAYDAALKAYDTSSAQIKDLPTVIAEDEKAITTVEANYATAKADLKAYALTVAEYRVEYDKYVSDNARDLAKHNKLIGDFDGVIYTVADGGRKTEKKEDKIFEAAKELLETYKKTVDAFDGDEDKENKEEYKTAKEFYDLLNGAIGGRTDEQIPQAVAAVKDLYEQSVVWKAQYEAKVAEYLNNLSYHNSVLTLFNLTNYGNLINERVNLNARIDELTAAIAAETDADKKTELESQLEKLNESLTTLNTNIDKAAETVDIYQKILNDPSKWTDDYYLIYCKNNKADEKFSAYKSAFEAILNAECSVGNSQRLTLVSDKLSLSNTIKNNAQYKNDGLTAYYAVEQLTMRLQTAINESGDLLQTLSEYYSKIKTSQKLEWLNVTDDMRETVHKDLSYSSHITALEEAIEVVKNTDIKTLLLKEFNIESSTTVNELVTGYKFKDLISGYTGVANDVQKFNADANLAANDYTVTPRITSTLMLIYDVIMIAVFAAYFAYTVCEAISSAKEENYENIKNTLSE